MEIREQERRSGIHGSAENELQKLRRENALLRAALGGPGKPVEESRPAHVLRGLVSSGVELLRSAARQGPGILLNAPEDTRYAHQATDFESVLHIFNKEWIGIRAAAGSLPGQKLAVSAKTALHREDVKTFFSTIAKLNANRFVFHGMSENIALLIRAMAKAGLSGQMYLVYHGSVAQWCYPPERKLAFEAIELARSGCLKRIHFMKRNHSIVEGQSFVPMLLNSSPVVPFKFKIESQSGKSVCLPGTDTWLKNLHCNALGAALSPSVEKVIHYAKAVELPHPYGRKLSHLNFVDRSSTLRLMAMCMCTLNVSLVECHPMVNLESEAVGTPCLRGPLNLDALEDHPYVGLVNVVDPTNPYQIRDAINRVCAVQRSELRDMISNYLAELNRISLVRYREFLEL